MRAATTVLPFLPVAEAAALASPAGARFTLDGDAGLEAHLARLCAQVRAGVEQSLPRGRLEGILLGGGYGRGEGGVRRTAEGDRPYNDLEFYLVLRGHTLLNDWLHRARLDALAHALSDGAGVEVEFKVISRADLREGEVTMFSYDLVHGHRRVCGPADLLAGCEHHAQAEDIPLAEATRLLLNRCTGLLFAQQRLAAPRFHADDADFVSRNLAKARLALGDALLALVGRYHWSCRERAARLAALDLPGSPPWWDAVRAEHAAGVAFKLRPTRCDLPAAALERELQGLSQLACRVWLWVESRRLGADFRSPVSYALHRAPKCQGSPAWRNWLLTARKVGRLELLSPRALRYPRERLLRTLPVLLWQPVLLVNSRVRRSVQRQLCTSATEVAGLVRAYTRLWASFR